MSLRTDCSENGSESGSEKGLGFPMRMKDFFQFPNVKIRYLGLFGNIHNVLPNVYADISSILNMKMNVWKNVSQSPNLI